MLKEQLPLSIARLVFIKSSFGSLDLMNTRYSHIIKNILFTHNNGSDNSKVGNDFDVFRFFLPAKKSLLLRKIFLTAIFSKNY